MAPATPQLRPRQRLDQYKFRDYIRKFSPQAYTADQTSRPGANGAIRSIAWNPLGSLVATGSADKTLRVWNPEKPNVRFSTELKGHQAPIERVAFNPVKDAELCSVSNDGVVKFWDVRTKACVNEVKGIDEAFTLAWAPDGQSLVVGTQSDKISILSPTEPTPRVTLQQPIQTNQISFCWSGTKVFVATGDGRTRIMSYPEFEPIYRVNYPVSENESAEFRLTGHTSSCLSTELSPTGRILATGGSDSMICLWDTSDWVCQKTIGKMTGPVRSISFSFDGSYVVGGSDDGAAIEVTHAESGEHVHTVKTAGPAPIVAWAPLRYQLAYSDLGVLRILGVDTDSQRK